MEIAQPWTSNTNALIAGIRNRNVTANEGSRINGTALFDAIYRTCLNDFGHIDNAAGGNFILLFSDGEDNASRASLRQAVDMCQRANTAIYAFHTRPKPNFTGGETLAELASESGGRLYYDDDTEEEINNDLGAIEADLRNQYRLVYKPAELKRDGSFHRVELNEPERVDRITIRSGYYAPTR